MARRIPRIVHFVFGLRPQDEPFHLVHYLAITSCREVVRPDEIHLHCNELPYGFYWDLVRPFVTLHRVDPVREVTEFPYDDPVVAHYSYAHQADFVRLDVLAEHGGMYADIDTAFVAPPRDELWEQSCVIGRERDVLDPRTNRARPSCSNALIMAEPGAPFVRAVARRASPARSTARGARTAASSPTTSRARSPATSAWSRNGRSTPSPDAGRLPTAARRA